MWLTIFLTGCASIGDYIPQDAVLSPAARADFGSELRGRPALRQKQSHAPVLPFTVFGLRYDKDIVLQSKDPSVDMLEIVMLEVPSDIAASGQFWFAKVSEQGGEQSLFSYSPEIETCFPEINAPRQAQETGFLVMHEQQEDEENVD